MKNRFKEMVDAGVAKFEYKNDDSNLPTLDPFVINYNIWWGIHTGTHMAKVMLEDTDIDTGEKTTRETYIITGSMFTREERYFGHMVYDSWVRGSWIPSSGYENLYCYFRKHGKDFKKITYNGSKALEIINLPETCDSFVGMYNDTPCCACNGFLMDSSQKIPNPISQLENKKGIFKELNKKCESLEDQLNRFNDSEDTKGYYHIMGSNLYCELDGRTYLIV